MKYDLVYPLGKGTAWQNNEIRYSIRSFVKHFKDLDKIYIIGERPDFLDYSNERLIHIPMEDEFNRNKDGNLIKKVLRACTENNISENFIRASDDQVILKDVTIEDFEPKYITNLVGDNFSFKNANRWKKRLERTKNLLQEGGFTTFHYESHYPMLYNRASFEDIFMNLELTNTEGVTINTFYFNNYLEIHKKLEKGFKVTLQRQEKYLTEKDLIEKSKGYTFLGYNNKGMRTCDLKAFLINKFSEVCNFEIL